MTDPSLNDIQTELHALRARFAELETKLGNAQPAAASGRERRFSKRWDFRVAPLAGLLFFTGGGGALYAGSAGEALFINPEGNIGIMTTSPKNALDVNGGLAIGPHYAGNEVASTGGAVIEGKVGIGAASPVAKLEVNLVNPQNWNGNVPGIRLVSPDGNYLMDVNTYVVASGNVGYQFSPNKLGTPNTGLNITSPGYVGIGTKSPKNALDVNGGIAIGANYAGSKAAPENGAVIQGAAHVGSLAITDAQGNPYKDNWIGMANNVNSDKTPWLHIGGISDDRKKDATVSGSVDGDGKRRIALYAHKTLVSNDLDVKGFLKTIGRLQVDDNAETTYEVTDRYHLSITSKKRGGTKTIPQDVMVDLCGDQDGCQIRIGMTKWDVNVKTAAASRSGLFYYGKDNGHWRSEIGDSEGIDGNGAMQHVINIWNSCYLVDGIYENGQDKGDGVKGMQLHWSTGDNNQDFRTCELTLID